MPRTSRSSMKRNESGATYYVRSRTNPNHPLFQDEGTKDWIYHHILWMSTVYFVNIRAVSVVDDRYSLVLSMKKPSQDTATVRKRFEKIQKLNQIPLKWYDWRTSEWQRKFADLSEFMKQLNQSIAKYVHESGICTGQVWRDRFKSEYLERDTNQLAAMAFVELSCTRAGLCSDPCHYKYCSVGRRRLAGNKSAGVVLPRKRAFHFLGKGEQRHKSFCLLMSRLAHQGHASQKTAQLECLLTDQDPKNFLRTHKRRPRTISISGKRLSAH